MGLVVKKKEGENPNAVVFRFVKKVKQSGILREARKRRFTKREDNKNKRRKMALHRVKKQDEFEKARKMGMM